jgi:hypothetical protein
MKHALVMSLQSTVKLSLLRCFASVLCILLCFCMQVTAKLAALCVGTLQQPDARLVPLPCRALCTWLTKAIAAMQASPGSHLAAAVRQQLQSSQLLQHLGPAMDAAAAQLTDAAAVLAAAVATTGSTTVDFTTSQDIITQLRIVQGLDGCCNVLLDTFRRAGRALSPTVQFTIAAALPAVPAAARLTLCVLKTHSMLQQQAHAAQPRGNCWVHMLHCWPLKVLLTMAEDLGRDGMLPSLPGTDEMLLSPDLVTCLAIALLVTVVGVDTSSGGDGTTAATTAAAGSSNGLTSRTGRQQRQHRQQQQQPLLWQAGSDSTSSGSDLSNGVRLDSLTPLSCSLFDVLGVTKEAVLQLASLADGEGLTTKLELDTLASAYMRVLKYQVSDSGPHSVGCSISVISVNGWLELFEPHRYRCNFDLI